MGKITVNVRALMDEVKINQMDLSRETRLATGTVAALAHGEGKGINYEVLAKLCGFFSRKLGRPIGPGDILKYEEDAR